MSAAPDAHNSAMDIKRYETQWGGKPLIIETGKYAQQAGGSVTVQYGDTVVLATAIMSESVREGIDFFPLQVEFEERLYAAGRIKGSKFIKKEGRPTDEAILVGRYIDRAIRPLFPDGIKNEVQVVVTCLAFDGENDPDVPGLIAASAALHISDIPWDGPIADVRVGQINGEWVLNPTYEARKKSVLDLGFAGTPDRILMVEAGANEAPEDTVLEAFWFGQKHLRAPIELIEQMQREVGKTKRDVLTPKTEAQAVARKEREEVQAMARPFIETKMRELFFGAPKATKAERRIAKNKLKEATIEHLLSKGVAEDRVSWGTEIIDEVIEAEVTRAILEEGKRVDGRSLTEVRPLLCEVAVLPRVHGSAHFMRGETQVVSVVTLGSPGDEQTLDGMETVGKRRYMHHYNFPPYSVGEIKPMRGPGRREIGHGALAERALENMLPDKESFPYTVRVVSEVFGSNGSSSMGSTCGSTLALMDAGVPIKAPVAGIAMGIATNARGDWKVLTDLQDLEDGDGGMDFKIAGTALGITAIQMDTKTHGLTREMVEQTFHQAKEGRMHILSAMLKAIATPRPDLSPYAPRIITLRIQPDQIGSVIGPGGKVINEIVDQTGVQAIDIEDDGLVMITSVNAAGAVRAKEWIEQLTRIPKVGETFSGKVTRLMDFGAFVEFLPKQEGLVHVSKLAPWHVQNVSDIVKIGDQVKVKIVEIDEMGRFNLSMKDAEGNTYPEKPPEGSLPPPRTFNRPAGRPPFPHRGGQGPRRP